MVARMPHIKTFIDTQRIICFKKYIEGYDSPWKHILSFFLKDYGRNFSYIAILAPLNYQTVFPVFIENALHSGPN